MMTNSSASKPGTYDMGTEMQTKNPELSRAQNKYLLDHDIIAGFPYKTFDCPACDRELQIVRVAHMQNKEHYKAIYVCEHWDCPIRKELRKDGHMEDSYVKLYFSSQKAYDNLSRLQMSFERNVNG
jgi:hypothetical protein